MKQSYRGIPAYPPPPINERHNLITNFNGEFFCSHYIIIIVRVIWSEVKPVVVNNHKYNIHVHSSEYRSYN